MSYFAVLTQHQPEVHVTRHIFDIASEIGFNFAHIEAFDRIQIGSFEFQRYEIKKDVSALLDAILLRGRCVIGQDNDGFSVRMGSKVAKVPISIMQSAPRTRKRYRGTSDTLWTRQFE